MPQHLRKASSDKCDGRRAQQNELLDPQTQTPLQARIARLESKRQSLVQRTHLLNERHRIDVEEFTPNKGIEEPIHEPISYRPLEMPSFTTPVTFRNIASCERELESYEEHLSEDRKLRMDLEKMLDAAANSQTPLEMWKQLTRAACGSVLTMEEYDNIPQQYLAFRAAAEKSGFFNKDEMERLAAVERSNGRLGWCPAQ
ncbi:hypothetical protein BJ508DRAFT_313560 [Ascobolus immersus RN42]|uniref:Uncharacterized protein n=1 Tax=Ascobolus immersus RN42 TaxID=1160509 RepID=A0A3N4HPE9_ASCIM|nr:hypothetical protein BJ508DRAFT_313560 [Ascobolus immersus RN42]